MFTFQVTEIEISLAISYTTFLHSLNSSLYFFKFKASLMLSSFDFWPRAPEAPAVSSPVGFCAAFADSALGCSPSCDYLGLTSCTISQRGGHAYQPLLGLGPLDEVVAFNNSFVGQPTHDMFCSNCLLCDQVDVANSLLIVEERRAKDEGSRGTASLYLVTATLRRHDGCVILLAEW